MKEGKRKGEEKEIKKESGKRKERRNEGGKRERGGRNKGGIGNG